MLCNVDHEHSCALNMCPERMSFFKHAINKKTTTKHSSLNKFSKIHLTKRGCLYLFGSFYIDTVRVFFTFEVVHFIVTLAICLHTARTLLSAKLT